MLSVNRNIRPSGLQVARTQHVRFSSSKAKPRVVILGSGWGGYEVLKRIDKARYDVTIISPVTYFNFTPLLASCAVGSLEYRCALEPVRRYTPQARAYQAWCDGIDFEEKSLNCMPATPPLPSAPHLGTRTPFSVPYDKLVISVGAYSQTFGVPGVKEHAYFLKDVRDARAIRTRILECFEQANEPLMSEEERRRVLHFCIVGGGPTGVEFAAELHDLLNSDIKRHFPRLAPLARISLYDVAPKILSMFDEGLVKYAVRTFRREGVEILTSHHVERVEAGRMYVKEQGEVAFGMLVWSTGLAPNPLVEAMKGVERDARTGGVVTNGRCEVVMRGGGAGGDVWAIGDAAVMEGVVLPATAQVAKQKARYVAGRLNGMLEGRDVGRPFEWRNMGTLAYVGEEQALYDRSQAKGGPKTKWAGMVSWVLWRSAYASMALSVRNKILVPTLWLVNWIFGRDLSRF
ncbi:FAD/NAD(P)-binding domain-containing protein [Neolentinus lepideus HHB14362 ss-1]|uniref:FAD/NAD(P)-binding domain-containing protein n=1 Tax=Neolentinus lepideus HHB14362 ss-1 TaxID=1314782 RepID=A0A165VS68_9AGAM|nr:FAD/NAD(P)-binding domain-containing protein [Neolentinus lepideus HHB14362 ss-1]